MGSPRPPGRPKAVGPAPSGGEPRYPAAGGRHFATGIVNSAPFGVLSGQRCITDFCRV